MKTKFAIMAISIAAFSACNKPIQRVMLSENDSPIVWNYPAADERKWMEGYFIPKFEVTKVELMHDATRVTASMSLRPDNWIGLENLKLKADGYEYALKSCEGFKLWELPRDESGKADMVFNFEPVHANAIKIDIVDKSDDLSLGIQNRDTKAQNIRNYTKWRNNSTGEWEIAFCEDFAIYNCKFWNYKSFSEANGGCQMELENGGATVNVDLSGPKENGDRSITINGKTADYSLITTITLPDYPDRDTLSEIANTHYQQNDTVTFVGWVKDMPMMLKLRGKELGISVESLLGSHNVGAKMDGDGRFEIKLPLVNTSELYIDWGRLYTRTVFEPGETYFLLYDFKEGHKLFMGSNCRLQNEILSHPISWLNASANDGENCDSFMTKAKSEYQKWVNYLDRELQKCPTLSNKYRTYVEGHYKTALSFSLTQAKYHIKTSNEYWDSTKKAIREIPAPINMYRDAQNVVMDLLYRDYYDKYKIVTREEDGSRWDIGVEFILIPEILKNRRDNGEISISDADYDLIVNYFSGSYYDFTKEIARLQTAKASEEEIKKYQEAFAATDIYKDFQATIQKPEIKQIMDETFPLIEIYAWGKTAKEYFNTSTSKAIEAKTIAGRIDQMRRPLSESEVNYVRRNIRLMGLTDYIMALNNKYVELENRDISQSASIKNAENIEGMSDGEKILNKLIEPYKGRIVLIDIWGTWCGPCKMALKDSQKEYEELKDYDIVYMYLCNRSSNESWQNVIKEYNVLGDNVVHYNLPEDQQDAIENFVGVSGYPTYKLIDKNGKLIDLEVNARELEDLKKVLEMIK
ncbi:MAG: redoxin family protein [Bacteroidales bacterium]|nr:redoxin family protein [Bacteroidales bacterium]